MDVHAINAITLTHLDAGANITESIVVLFQYEISVGSKINHDFVILSLFNRLQGMAQVKLRQWPQNGTRRIQRETLQHPQHAFEDVEQAHTPRVHHAGLL